MKQLISAALTAGALLSGAQAFAADCGKIVIGEMNWASGEFLARLDGLIMSEGYQCDVEYLTAGTMPQITSMNETNTKCTETLLLVPIRIKTIIYIIN